MADSFWVGFSSYSPYKSAFCASMAKIFFLKVVPCVEMEHQNVIGCALLVVSEHRGVLSMDTASYGQNMTGFGQSYGEMDGHLLRIQGFELVCRICQVYALMRDC